MSTASKFPLTNMLGGFLLALPTMVMPIAVVAMAPAASAVLTDRVIWPAPQVSWLLGLSTSVLPFTEALENK
jgi:hypothetical protein